jgi:hypothetical protein
VNEEIKANSRKTVCFSSSAGDKENEGEAAVPLPPIPRHAPCQSAASHARTVSDYDSVILMGGDDSMM